MTDSAPKLRMERFLTDPRVLEARRLLREARGEHQAKLDGVRPADPAHAVTYERLLRELGEARGRPLYYPYLGSGFGDGALVELADGSVKYDMITGIGVHVTGHSHPALMDALLDAALADTVMQGNLQQNTDSAALAADLMALARADGGALEHVFLTSSGVMANENALKMIFQARHPANRLLAFESCFAGRTLAVSQITDREKYREGLPPSLAVDYVPYFKSHDPEGSTQQALRVLERHLARYPGRHAGMMFEMVQGEGGYNAGDAVFFRALMEKLREHGVAVMVDEVQTFGRTARPFAFQHFGLADLVDVVTVGKMLQVCATFFSAAYVPRPGLISQTFTSSTSAIRAGRATLAHLDSIGAFGAGGRNEAVHARFVAGFEAIRARHPELIRGPYGLGGMIAFTALDGSLDAVKRLLNELYDRGLIAFLAGSLPARVRMLPPLGAVTDEDIDAVCAIVEDALVQIGRD